MAKSSWYDSNIKGYRFLTEQGTTTTSLQRRVSCKAHIRERHCYDINKKERHLSVMNSTVCVITHTVTVVVFVEWTGFKGFPLHLKETLLHQWWTNYIVKSFLAEWREVPPFSDLFQGVFQSLYFRQKSIFPPRTQLKTQCCLQIQGEGKVQGVKACIWRKQQEQKHREQQQWLRFKKQIEENIAFRGFYYLVLLG